MNKTCPVCKLNFEVEPGFFIGAMYVSYAFSVAILFITGAIFFLISDDPSVRTFAMVAFVPVVILHPVIYRYSRVIYLYLFGGIHYNPDGDK